RNRHVQGGVRGRCHFERMSVVFEKPNCFSSSLRTLSHISPSLPQNAPHAKTSPHLQVFTRAADSLVRPRQWASSPEDRQRRTKRTSMAPGNLPEPSAD